MRVYTWPWQQPPWSGRCRLNPCWAPSSGIVCIGLDRDPVRQLTHLYSRVPGPPGHRRGSAHTQTEDQFWKVLFGFRGAPPRGRVPRISRAMCRAQVVTWHTSIRPITACCMTRDCDVIVMRMATMMRRSACEQCDLDNSLIYSWIEFINRKVGLFLHTLIVCTESSMAHKICFAVIWISHVGK